MATIGAALARIVRARESIAAAAASTRRARAEADQSLVAAARTAAAADDAVRAASAARLAAAASIQAAQAEIAAAEDEIAEAIKPPPPVPRLQQGLTCDHGLGAPTKDYWCRALGITWARGPLGDWLDRDQVPNGPEPYATSAPIQAIGEVRIDVTALVRRWLSGAAENRGIYLSALGGGGYEVTLAGRTAAGAPRLILATAAGTADGACTAAACWHRDAYRTYSRPEAFGLAASAQPAIVRFDLPRLPGDLVSAELVLTVTVLQRLGTVVDVMEADPPRVIVPEEETAGRLLGIYAECGGRFTDLAAHPDVITARDFREGGGLPVAAGWSVPATREPLGDTVAARSKIPAGRNLGCDLRVDVSRGTGPRGGPDVVLDELYAQYWLWLDEDFRAAPGEAIKLPCIGGQFGYWNSVGYWQQTAGNGGAVANGMRLVRASGQYEYQGHSTRITSGVGQDPGSPYADCYGAAMYPYNLDQGGPNPPGEGWRNVVLRKRRWHCIDLFMRQNSLTGEPDAEGNREAVADGILRAWVNGVLAYERTSFRWRRHPDIGVQGLWLDVYHGGRPPAPKDCGYMLGRVSLARRYIGPPAALSPVRDADIRLQVEADRLFSSYKWAWGVESAGQVQGAVNIPEAGLHGFDLGGGLGTMRFGKVADPDDPSRTVLMFRANAGDPLIHGGPRCEMTFSPSFGGKLPVNQDVWFAFGIRLQDWSSSTDEQVLMQWHWSNGSIPIGPFLALALKAGRLQIDSKANADYPPAPATSTSTVHWNGPVTPNRWSYFVVKARISPHLSDGPYLKVWRDGVQIVDHQGPFGYNYPEVTPYLKIGHYQWARSYNTWSSTAQTKTVLVRAPALINDTTGRYTEADIRAHVKAR